MKTEKKRISKRMHFISKRTGEAIADHDMLKDGDNIMVAVSGSLKSLSLLKLLKYRRSFVPIDIDIMAVYIDSGKSRLNIKKIEDYFKSLNIKYSIEMGMTPNLDNADDPECCNYFQERQKIFFSLVKKFGCNKIALAQDMDDIAESILSDLILEGKEPGMCPKQVVGDGKITVIRPLAYVSKKDIEAFAESEGIPRITGDKESTRAPIKKILRELESRNPYIKRNIIRSMYNIKQEYLL